MARLLDLPGLTLDAQMPAWLKSLTSGVGAPTAPGGLSSIAPPAPQASAALPNVSPEMTGTPGSGALWDMILGTLPTKMAEAGIPPPPTPGEANVPGSSVMGAPPPPLVGAQGASTTPATTNAAAPPGPNITQFDLLTGTMPGLGSANPEAPMVLPGAPGSPEDIAASLKAGAPPAPSPLSQVRAPEAPKPLNPSTPSVPQMRDVNLDPMMHILQQALAGGKIQQLQLPQLSAFLQRRPQG